MAWKVRLLQNWLRGLAGQKWGDLRDTDRSVRKVEKVWSAKDTLIANNMEELAVRFVRANKVLGVAVFDTD